jgi:hypothetical protein
MMKQQNFENHTRLHPIYHYYLLGALLLALIGAVINLFQAEAGLLTSGLLLFLVIIMMVAVFLLRIYPLKAQDRAIRAEENLRHYVLTGKLLDSRLSVAQIVALRFASDEEFVELAKKAASENLKPKDIKKAIKQWKADHNRI